MLQQGNIEHFYVVKSRITTQVRDMIKYFRRGTTKLHILFIHNDIILAYQVKFLLKKKKNNNKIFM